MFDQGCHRISASGLRGGGSEVSITNTQSRIASFEGRAGLLSCAAGLRFHLFRFFAVDHLCMEDAADLTSSWPCSLSVRMGVRLIVSGRIVRMPSLKNLSDVTSSSFLIIYHI